MLEKIMQRRQELQKQYYRKMPMLIKISPDLTPENIRFMVALAQQCKLDGIVAVNTSNKRNHLKETAKIDVKGGLSGAPLTATAEEFLTIIKKLAPQLTVISIGGIMSAADAEKRLQLGADLIQVYTGLIYEGPSLISKVLK
jgi:dihydroorotate dehydrogenase